MGRVGPPATIVRKYPSVVLVHNHYRQAGGEDVVLAAESSLLRQSGHQVLEFVRHNRLIRRFDAVGVFQGAVWSRRAREDLRALLRSEHVGIAHFHNIFPLISPSAYYACRSRNVPVVQTLHNYRLLCPGATLFRNGRVCEDCLRAGVAWGGIRCACYRNSRAQTAAAAAMVAAHHLMGTWRNLVDVYIALTEFARRKFIEGGFPEDKIVVKPNFVYPDPGVRNGDGDFALFVGRFSPEKGVRTMLGAWQRVVNVPLKLVGDGPMLAEASAFVENRRLNCVEFLGWRPREEVLALMKGARFLVFPSEWYEGFPIAIAEAFACGVPVIASRLGAMAEIVEDGRTGLHFNPSDPLDLTAKVEWAWTHPERMREMGREARREYELKYTAERNYRMLMEIYNRAIENARKTT